MTVKEEDEFMLTTCADDEDASSDENNDRALEAVAHYIMIHYEEKEKLKKRKRNTGPRLGNTASMLGFVILMIEWRWQSQRSCIKLTCITSLCQLPLIA